MKRISIRSPLKLAALAVALTAGMASAQQSTASASADASAEVVAAIGITRDASGNMNFGKLVAGATAGTVILTPAGARSATGGTTLGNSTGVSAAKFTVTGNAGSTFAITLPSTSFNVVNGTATMSVGTFTSSPATTGTIGTGGSVPLTVGATLSVGASQVSGTYSSGTGGALTVTVAYN